MGVLCDGCYHDGYVVGGGIDVQGYRCVNVTRCVLCCVGYDSVMYAMYIGITFIYSCV